MKEDKLRSEKKVEDNLKDEQNSIKKITTPEIVSEDDIIKVCVESKEPNLQTRIVNLVQDEASLFTDGKETAYAMMSISDHKELWPVNSKRFAQNLYRIGREENDGNIPSPEAISSAIKYLEAISFEGPEIELNNRVAKSDGSLWYDLTNPEWQVVKIDQHGWEIIDDSPALFKRQVHQKPQVEPVRDGDIWSLFDFIRIDEDKKLLLLVYIISCFIPDIPHPVLLIYGPPGAGKSSTMEFIREIIDPSLAPRLKTPTGDKEVVQIFDHHYATFFDNMDVVPKWFSDVLCRAVTGEGSEYRALYTNEGAVIRSYRRCVTLNGVNIAATKADLLDRSILMELSKFDATERIEEAKLRKNFSKKLPGILGAIFDTLSKALPIYPLTNLECLPRMADFAKWGYAITEALGKSGEEFLDLYLQDEKDRVNETINSSPLATAIVELIKEEDEWSGTATELLYKLEDIANKNRLDTTSNGWPKNNVWVSRKINMIIPSLEKLGVICESPQKNGQKGFTIHIKEDQKNTENTEIPIQKVQDISEIENNNENRLNSNTVKSSVKNSKLFSKVNAEQRKSKIDGKNSIHSKISKFKSSPVNYEELPRDELYRLAKVGDEKANDILQNKLLKEGTGVAK